MDTLQGCAARKVYAITIKLLAVYASHVLTIKIQPGLGKVVTIHRYIAAALIPSTSAHTPITDFMFLFNQPRFSGVNQIRDKFMSLWRWPRSDPLDQEVHNRRNMQMAINCGAVCVRVKHNRIPHGARVIHTPSIVRAKPLQVDEVFIIVPRGTPAYLFEEMMIRSSSYVMKALVGGAQILFATLQLLSATDPRVTAYGYGAFIYTIIPYALGSFINLVSLIFTGNYSDLTEMEVVVHDIDWNYDDINREVLWVVGVLELAVYFVIVGGITHFRPGISSFDERYLFLTWVVFGTLFGVESRIPPSTRAVQLLAGCVGIRLGIDESADSTMAVGGRAGSTMPMDEEAGDTLLMPERAGGYRSAMTEIDIAMAERAASTMATAEIIKSRKLWERMQSVYLLFITLLNGVSSICGILVMIRQYIRLFPPC